MGIKCELAKVHELVTLIHQNTKWRKTDHDSLVNDYAREALDWLNEIWEVFDESPVDF